MNSYKDLFFRIFFLAGFLFTLFALLIGQFFHLQIIEGEQWKRKAVRQHYFYVNEPFIRGSFYSNNSEKKIHPENPQKLAFDIQKYHLYIDPANIPEECKKNLADDLLLLLPECNEKKFHEQFFKKSRMRRLYSFLDVDVKEKIEAFWRPFYKKYKIQSNALFFVGDSLRSHPFKGLLGQVLHTTRLQKDDRTQTSYPTGGLELSLNKYLTGRQGKRRLLRSPRHELETNHIIEEPENGADVYLTINHCLQAICEEEVEKGVKRTSARSGWAVMMNPQTGEILALAQYPFFNPDEYHLYFNNPDAIEHTKVKAFSDANEPGSVMKAITAACALKANKVLKKPLFLIDEKIPTSKGNFPGRGKKPLKDARVHPFLNMHMAIQKSSNIYPATLVHRIITELSPSWYRNELANTFGFGKKTFLELPSESLGVLPTPHKLHPNGTLEWSKSTPYSLSMGHNLQATSIQMIRAFALFANNGYLVEPTLIKKIVKGDKVLLDHSERHLSFPRVLDEDIVKEVVKAMKFTTKKGGTAPWGNVWGYSEAGKTGTSMKIIDGQYTSKKHVSSFIGFTPVKNPAFVLLVTMEEPKPGFTPGKGSSQSGGVSCSPVFREIASRSLEYLGIPPDDPYGYPSKDPRFHPEKADWYKEVAELQELYAKWNLPSK